MGDPPLGHYSVDCRGWVEETSKCQKGVLHWRAGRMDGQQGTSLIAMAYLMAL